MWMQQTNEYVNSSWAAGGQSSAAVQNNPPTAAYDFLELTRPQEEDQQLYGRGHRQGHPPNCGTISHRYYY